MDSAEIQASTQLFLVPTPVGNLQDMTYRAVQVLQEVDVILAEDTRTSSKLLKHFAIQRPLQAYHIFNEHKAVDRLIERMRAGEVFALISDAGTPGISDPGYLLVRAVVQAGLRVSTLPGATAFVPALLNSGLPNDRFVFEGFLPHKKGKQRKLESLAKEERTLIFYESPHRIAKTLRMMEVVFGPDREACLCRELSKKFEENRYGTLAEWAASAEAEEVRGELVLIVAGAAPEPAVSGADRPKRSKKWDRLAVDAADETEDDG